MPTTPLSSLERAWEMEAAAAEEEAEEARLLEGGKCSAGPVVLRGLLRCRW